MEPVDQNTAPPLAVWAWVAVFLGCFAVVASLQQYIAAWQSDEDAAIFAAYNTHRISVFKATVQEQPGSRHTVVALGASILGCATHADQKKPIDWFRILKVAGTSYDLDLMPMLISLQPKVILFSEEILREDRQPSLINPLSQNVAVHFANVLDLLAKQAAGSIKTLFTGIPVKNYRLESEMARQTELRCTAPKIASQREDMAYYAQELKGFFNPAVGLSPTLQTLLQQLNQHHIRVILLRIPRHPLFVPMVESHFKHWWDKVAEQIQSLSDVSILSPPFTLSEDSFADHSHMNAAGRNQFNPWLTTQLEYRP